jgi:hypothetical protein
LSSTVTHAEAAKAVQRLKPAMQDGNGVLTGDSFKNAIRELYVHLALVTSSMFTQGHVIDYTKI